VRLNKRLAILLVAITLALFPFNLVSAQEDISLPATVSAFNQEYQGPNGYWGNCGLGTNGCPDKISTTGCLITAFAMVLDYYNVSLFIPREFSCTDTARTGMDPGILNDWLKTHGGYGKCGSDIGSCCLEWTNLPPQVSVTKHVNRSERGIDSTAQRMIDQSLLQGYPVIGGVHWDSYCHGATTQTEDCHWVVITGKSLSASSGENPPRSCSRKKSKAPTRRARRRLTGASGSRGTARRNHRAMRIRIRETTRLMATVMRSKLTTSGPSFNFRISFCPKCSSIWRL